MDDILRALGEEVAKVGAILGEGEGVEIVCQIMGAGDKLQIQNNERLIQIA